MIVAVPCAGTRVAAQFGSARAFAIATVEAGSVKGAVVVERPEVEGAGIEGAGPHGGVSPGTAAELVGFFREHGVEVILTGTISYPLQQALKSAGFTLYSGVSGDVTAALEAFMRDDIEPAAPSSRPLHGPPWAR